MDTLSLFDVGPHPRARGCDPQTSWDAARSITPEHTEGMLTAIFAGGGSFTDDELCEALPDLYGPTVKTARSRLSGAGRLVDTGERRPSARGRQMIVWRKAS